MSSLADFAVVKKILASYLCFGSVCEENLDKDKVMNN